MSTRKEPSLKLLFIVLCIFFILLESTVQLFGEDMNSQGVYLFDYTHLVCCVVISFYALTGVTE